GVEPSLERRQPVLVVALQGLDLVFIAAPHLVHLAAKALQVGRLGGGGRAHARQPCGGRQRERRQASRPTQESGRHHSSPRLSTGSRPARAGRRAGVQARTGGARACWGSVRAPGAASSAGGAAARRTNATGAAADGGSPAKVASA